MENKTILCTGSTGFLGSNLCNRLVREGHFVVSFDNNSRNTGFNTLHPNIVKITGDIRNFDDLDTVCKKYKFDTIFHLAAINGTDNFYNFGDDVLEVGVKGIINILDICQKYKINNVAFTSTSEVYNVPTEVPTQETERAIIPDVYNPRFSYSGSKIISELLLINYQNRGIKSLIYRPHNLIGKMGTTHFIPQIIEKIISPKNPKYTNDGKLIIEIQGDGTETRSFCYIDEAVNQMIYLFNKNETGIFNIGIEQEITISEMTNKIANILDIPIEIKTSPVKKGSTNRRCPSMKKLYDLGYKGKSDIYGLEKTVLWYEEYFKGLIK